MRQSDNRNYIPQELIDDIRAQSDIVQVISDCGVALQPAGKEYKALCPFHEEKAPSFSVSPEKQMFYCFGCQAGGTVFNFLQKYEGISYIEAVKRVANQIGIALPGEEHLDKVESLTIGPWENPWPVEMTIRHTNDGYSEEVDLCWETPDTFSIRRGKKIE